MYDKKQVKKIQYFKAIDPKNLNFTVNSIIYKVLGLRLNFFSKLPFIVFDIIVHIHYNAPGISHSPHNLT
jgi:hypothetical protein